MQGSSNCAADKKAKDEIISRLNCEVVDPTKILEFVNNSETHAVGIIVAPEEQGELPTKNEGFLFCLKSPGRDKIIFLDYTGSDIFMRTVFNRNWYGDWISKSRATLIGSAAGNNQIPIDASIYDEYIVVVKTSTSEHTVNIIGDRISESGQSYASTNGGWLVDVVSYPSYIYVRTSVLNEQDVSAWTSCAVYGK